MIAGRCSEPWAGKTGAHLRMSTFPPVRAPKRFRATGMIPGNLPPGSISARRINGCCSLVFPMTPARSIRMTAPLICPSIGRFVMLPGFSISGAIGSRSGAQFVYADYGKAKIDNDLLKGDYKRNDIFFFAMNANWKF